MTKNSIHKIFNYNNWGAYNALMRYSQAHTFPGSGGKSIKSVLKLLIEGFRNSALAIRASALAFKFMMAAIPALILINTAIPLLLPEESKFSLMEILSLFLPKQIFSSIEDPVKHTSNFVNDVISITAITTFYFAVNGMRSIIAIFNNSYHIKENRSLPKQYATAIILVIILLIVAAVAAPIFLLNQKVIAWLIGNNLLSSFWSSGLVFIVKYTFFFFFLTFIITSVYFLAPAKKQRFHLFSPGTIISSLLIVISSIGFDAFINEYTRYKEVYGGISALFILMLFIFMVSMITLIGFEINAALYFGKENIEKNT